MKKILKESWEWIDLEDMSKLPKDRLLKVVSKTTNPTKHPEDAIHPLRLFAEAEVMLAARSLIGKNVGIDHQRMPIHGAYCVDADWNEEEKQAEAVLLVPPFIVDKVKEGKIGKCSIEYNWRSASKKGKGTTFKGLNLTRIDLLEALNPGDKDSVVTLFEGKQKKGNLLMEVTLGEPLDRFADWDECMAWANAQKAQGNLDDPEAYCGSLKAKEQEVLVEDPVEEVAEIVEEVLETIPEVPAEKVEEIAEVVAEEIVLEPVEQEVPTTKEDCENAGGEWNEETQTCVLPAKEPAEEQEEITTKEQCEEAGGTWNEETKTCTLPEEPTPEELKESLVRVMKAHKELKESVNTKLETAVKEAVESMSEKIEKVIPHPMVIRRFGLGNQRFVSEVRKIIKESREG